MRIAELVDVSLRVTAAWARGAKIDALAALLRRLDPDEVEIAASYLAGQLRQGKIGLGWAIVREVRASTEAAHETSLTVLDVDRALTAIAAAKGAGSSTARRRLLGELLARATS